MTVHFELATHIDAPPELVFDLSLSVDLHLDSMSHAGEELIACSAAGLMGLGDTVTWRARHFGLRWNMTSKITEWDRPHRFVDEQQKGPFSRFRHIHTFEEVAPGQTAMKDEIFFDAPLAQIGDVVEKLLLGRYLEQLMIIRNTELKTRAEEQFAAES